MKSPSPAIVLRYEERGYYAPIPVMSAVDEVAIRKRLEAYEAEHGVMKGEIRHKSHLLFTWLDELIRHPAILDAVQDVSGPDILCWVSSSSSRRRAIPPSSPGTRTATTWTRWHTAVRSPPTFC